MPVSYEILLQGNSVMLDVGYLGMTNITLITTDDGPILVDVGHMVNWQGLEKALAERGFAPRDISKIFLSHIHNDHVLNIHKFAETADVFISRVDYEYAANPHPDDPFVPFMIREQLAKYNLHLIEGTGELASGVRYLPAPGHTPGCMALVLDTADGAVVVAQDAIKFPKELVTGQVNHAFDTQESAQRSIAELLTLGDRIIPGHYTEFVKRDGKFVWDTPSTVTLKVR